MDHFAGLDVSVKDTSVCIVDGAGKIVREVKVASEPQALLAVLGNATYCFKRIGLEAGPLSQWLYGALAEAGLPVICVETRHMRAVLKAQINKTDRNDARGIAQLLGRKVSWLLAAGACYFVRFWEQSELSANASACGALTADAMEWSR